MIASCDRKDIFAAKPATNVTYRKFVRAVLDNVRTTYSKRTETSANPTRATASTASVRHWTVSVVSFGAMEVYLGIANVLSSSTLRDPSMGTADRITTTITSVVIPNTSCAALCNAKWVLVIPLWQEWIRCTLELWYLWPDESLSARSRVGRRRWLIYRTWASSGMERRAETIWSALIKLAVASIRTSTGPNAPATT